MFVNGSPLCGCPSVSMLTPIVWLLNYLLLTVSNAHLYEGHTAREILINGFPSNNETSRAVAMHYNRSDWLHHFQEHANADSTIEILSLI
jgi:hypothetical protein